ncbi:MAG TPA: hypothetical protein DCP92_06095 [Nitrospiraceae bacterium]|nr:hypothetical protein [Nitrospiraceae bacterium]
MMKKTLLLSGILALFAATALLPRDSQAVPSFARQIQKPCTACHTIWPNLNQYGRQFKVKAYTDVAPDWQMINKDRLNLLYVFPVSARAIFYPFESETNTVTGNTSTTELNTVDLYLAGRVFDYAGVFGNFEATNPTTSGQSFTFDIPTMKLAFQYPLGGSTSTDEGGTPTQGSTIGLVAFKGLATSADPFNSLGGRDRGLIFDTESVPWILSEGYTLDFWSGANVGVVAHGYFLGNRLYAAVGAERGGNSSDAGEGFNNNSNTDPFDGYFRLAWDQKLPNGAVTFGGAWYTGKQRLLDNSGSELFDSNVNRGYIDASLEQNYGEDHLVEVQALYGHGMESNVYGGGQERKFDGFNIEASYFYDRTIGLVGDYNFINIQGVLPSDAINSVTGNAGTDQNRLNTWVAAINYLPWLNTKVVLQYAQTRTKFAGGEPDETDKIFRVIFDILF